MIKFAKLQHGYSVHAREPSVQNEWHSLLPLSAKAAIAELTCRGAKLADIKLALFEADPHWRSLP
jgi:hypothetical protein